MSKSGKDNNDVSMASVEGVRRLEFDRVDLNRQRPKAKARVHRQASMTESMPTPANPVGDTTGTAAESFFQHGISRKLQRSIRSGKHDIDAVLDLHGYQQHQANRELERFLQQALSGRLRMLLIIHGKGYRSRSDAVMRPLVQRWLKNQPMVLGFCPAQPRDGGHGASYVYLKSAQ